MIHLADENIEVPFEGDAQDKAVLLMEAAQSLDLPKQVVRTGNGVFIVPKEVHDKAFGKSGAKKTAAKAPAKKTDSKE